MTFEKLIKIASPKMSQEDELKLINDLKKEILKGCTYIYDPAGDKEAIKQITSRNEELMKLIRENHNEHLMAKTGIPNYPVNDLSKIDDSNLTKQQLLENLGCQIMQELFQHPFRFLRLRWLNACEVYRRENQKARENGTPLPYPNENPKPETDAERKERCYGITAQSNFRSF